MNAVEAMAETPSDTRRITVHSRLGGDTVDAAVSDTGPGLRPIDERGVFEPFDTTKPSGLGIGLTIAQTIVDAHGGTLTAANNPEGGATFSVSLPSHRPR